MTTEEIRAIRTVLDKLTAIEGCPVEFTSDWQRRAYGINLPPLTSEEVAAARHALDNAS